MKTMMKMNLMKTKSRNITLTQLFCYLFLLAGLQHGIFAQESDAMVSPQVKESIQNGLKFLAKSQKKDGSFEFGSD